MEQYNLSYAAVFFPGSRLTGVKKKVFMRGQFPNDIFRRG